MEKLEFLLQKVNQEYFRLDSLPSIMVSQGKAKEERKAIIFGSYHPVKNEVRIHPILLREDVPEFVIEFIIYHELLHYEDRDSLLVRKKGQAVHTSKFRQRERKFYQHDEAQILLKKILRGEPLLEEEVEERKVPEKISESEGVLPSKAIKRKRLFGEELEQALTESLRRLDMVMAKYADPDNPQQGVKRGSKKRNEKNQLAGNY